MGPSLETAMIVKIAPETDEFARTTRWGAVERVPYIFEVDGVDYVRTKDFSIIIGSAWCWGCPRTRAISIDFPRGMGTNDSYLWPLDVALKARKIKKTDPSIGVTRAVEMAVPMLRRINKLLQDRCWKVEP